MKALITGASSGIGLEFAQQLHSDGWEVYGIARSEEKLKVHFKDGCYLAADLLSSTGMQQAEAWINTHGFNLLINNAGFGLYKRFTEGPLEDQLRMMHLNMDVLVRLSYAFLQQAKPGDALMNISSALSLLPMPGSAVYSATKSFVTSFSECLWYEYRDKDIYVFADLPGPVRTHFHEVAGGSTDDMDPKLVLEPSEVVKEALKVLRQRKKPMVVNGTPFKVFTRMGQMMSHQWRLNTMAKNGPLKH